MDARIQAARFGRALPPGGTIGACAPLGPYYDASAPGHRSIEDVLERTLAPLGVPVLYRAPLGHGKHLATIPLGVSATLDADARSLTIEQPGVVRDA
jgi:muramoyltetrapeptide carboxypeptidase